MNLSTDLLWISFIILLFQGSTVLGSIQDFDDYDTGYSSVSDTSRLWPNGKVYYRFENSGSFTSNERNNITKQMDIIMKQLPTGCIEFIESNTLFPVLVIKQQTLDCRCTIGSISKNDLTLNLGLPRCFSDKGVILHELTHSLGFVHEQNRPDRNKYVEVKEESVSGNTHTVREKKFGEMNQTPYDYFSILHYPVEKGCTPGEVCVKVREPYKSYFNKSGDLLKEYPDSLSSVDVVEISRAYNCSLTEEMMKKYEEYERIILNAGNLLNASKEGLLEIVKFYVNNGAYVNAYDEKGETSLVKASEAGHLNVVEYLVENGANVNAYDYDWKTSLMRASANGHINVVIYLVDKGANVQAYTKQNWNTSLMYASQEGHLDVVRALLDSEADIQAKSYYGWTSLMYASQEGHLDVVRALVDRGADVHAKDNDGWTSLIYASEQGHLDVVRALVDSGADIHAKSNSEWTSLIYASYYGHLDVVRFLVASGANINAKNILGITALDRAIEEGHTQVVEYLKQKGAKRGSEI